MQATPLTGVTKMNAKMNPLEIAVLGGACKAQRVYEGMANGNWLSHGPESFLQSLVALQIRRLGYSVYVDASIKKSQRDQEAPRRGRPAGNSGQRPDISVWYKSKDKLRAIVEIKRTYDAFGPVERDADKLTRMMAQGHAACGYLLVYTEANGLTRLRTLRARLRDWESRLSWALVGDRVSKSNDPEWAWGMGLYRFAG